MLRKFDVKAISHCVLLVVALAAPEKLLAQGPSATGVSSNHRERHLGAGLLVAPNNASDRVAVPSGTSTGLWCVDGGFMVGRVGVGAEVLRSGRAVAVAQTLKPVDEQYDTLVAGMARFRLVSGVVVRLDAIAALGAAVQRRDTATLTCAGRCSRFDRTSTDTTLLTGVGLDIPVSLASNVDVVGIVRVYAHERQQAALPDGQGEWASRPMLGVAGRFRW